MIGPAEIAAVAVVVGGVVAVSVRDSRLVALGLLLALTASPLASSPQPGLLAICFRAIGALLATYLLWASARSQSIASEGAGIGAAAQLAAVCAVFAAGWFVVPVKPLAGPVAVQAAGISLVALAIVPLSGRDVLRAGTGAAVLTVGISLLLQAWVGPASSAQQIALTVLLVGLVGATSLLISPIPLASPAPDPAQDVAEPTEPPAVGEPAGDDVESGSDHVPAPAAAPAAAATAAPGAMTAATAVIPVRTANVRTSARRLRPHAPAAPAVPSQDDRPAVEPNSEVEPGPRFSPRSAVARRLHPREPRR
jgi:hypothetical protein